MSRSTSASWARSPRWTSSISRRTSSVFSDAITPAWRERIGLKGLLRALRNEAPRWASMLPQLPRLVHRALADDRVGRIEYALDDLIRLQRRRTRVLEWIALLLAAALAWAVFLTAV